MTDPNSPQKQPYVVVLKPGDYYWCACGQSKRQPYCDGSHRGSVFTPVKHTQKTEGEVFFCGCKRTDHPPFCDGTHKKL